MKASLTVFFEDPFWVGIFERIEDGKLSVCKVTFGAEPKDYEVWDYILHHYYELVFSPAVEMEIRQAADNPKRRRKRGADIDGKHNNAFQNGGRYRSAALSGVLSCLFCALHSSRVI